MRSATRFHIPKLQQVYFLISKSLFLEDFCYAHCSFSQQFFFSFLWKGTCRAVYSKLCHRLRRTGRVATLLLSGEVSTNPMVNLTSFLRFYVQLDEIETKTHILQWNCVFSVKGSFGPPVHSSISNNKLTCRLQCPTSRKTFIYEESMFKSMGVWKVTVRHRAVDHTI